ncbi:4-hydroxy-tetrahydrodipicolinate synthase [Nakamurella panacisegetis]|uniref:4-hydroxy-tetrahydrodipicolinate synthase n=1 Tax=Nakamurella panacisegetis TaxID=1090615 RepID=A0A1H0LHS7_9ACTN|nr:dihydrodipicolinate synthase family protein [Nakamurella panacisegetis]SDO67480.1 4-hydroxy-tetrahydrodipicolinate synthase [Nakamurella panacisegetis]
MSIPRVNLGGVIPILVTPFLADGSIDVTDLKAELDFLVSAGVDWVGIGYGSEVNKLDPLEVVDLVAATVQAAAGRVKVLGNAEVPSTRAGIAAVRRAVDAGADAVMVRPTGLMGSAVAEVVRAFVETANETGAALVIQDAPQNTGVELSASCLVEIARQAPTVAALKIEPPAPGPKMSEIRALAGTEPITMLGGLGGAGFVQELVRGSMGTMPGPAFPDVFAAVHRLFLAGDRGAATRLLWRIAPFTVLGSRDMESFLYIQKYLLRRRGVIGTTSLRGPHRPIDALLQGEIDDLIVDLETLELLDQETS